MKTFLKIILIITFLLSCDCTSAKQRSNDNSELGLDVRVNNQSETEEQSARQYIADANSRQYIWFYIPTRDPVESLEYAFSSGVITHAAIIIGGRLTENWLEDKKYRPRILSAVELAKKNNIEVIIFRFLWPTHTHKTSNPEDIFNWGYYINEIASLRSTARSLDVNSVGFDLEAYAKSPMGKYIRWKSKYRFTDGDNKKLQTAIDKVMLKAGQVDYVYPAGSIRKWHPYNKLSSLGKMKISEHTYYDDKKYVKLDYPSDVFGVYVNTQRFNKNNPRKPYYLVSRVFVTSGRWDDKTGVFFYPKEGKSLDVARELYKYCKEQGIGDK